MKVLRTRRLAGRAGCAALALGVAAAAGTVPAQAQARGTAAVAPSHVVASWGEGGLLGDGTTTSRSRYVDIGAGASVVQVATGWGTRVGHGLAVRSDGPPGPGDSTERASWATVPRPTGSRRFR
jgi:hypothetical protein